MMEETINQGYLSAMVMTYEQESLIKLIGQLIGFERSQYP